MKSLAQISLRNKAFLVACCCMLLITFVFSPRGPVSRFSEQSEHDRLNTQFVEGRITPRVIDEYYQDHSLRTYTSSGAISFLIDGFNGSGIVGFDERKKCVICIYVSNTGISFNGDYWPIHGDSSSFFTSPAYPTAMDLLSVWIAPLKGTSHTHLFFSQSESLSRLEALAKR